MPATQEAPAVTIPAAVLARLVAALKLYDRSANACTDPEFWHHLLPAVRAGTEALKAAKSVE